jgi:NADH dehydrogenase
MDILVVGGDGFVGRHLCPELVDRGHAVTSLSRSPDAEALPDEIETASGDVTDYDSIEGAFEGRDAAINLTALPPLHQPQSGTSTTRSVSAARWTPPTPRASTTWAATSR